MEIVKIFIIILICWPTFGCAEQEELQSYKDDGTNKSRGPQEVPVVKPLLNGTWVALSDTSSSSDFSGEPLLYVMVGLVSMAVVIGICRACCQVFCKEMMEQSDPNTPSRIVHPAPGSTNPAHRPTAPRQGFQNHLFFASSGNVTSINNVEDIAGPDDPPSYSAVVADDPAKNVFFPAKVV